MERELHCLRCGERMRFARREKLQLGEMGWLIGDWGNLLAGAMEVDFYCCPACGKIELFQPRYDGEGGGDYAADDLPHKLCPACGKEIDFDFPRCPYCKAPCEN